MAQVERVTGLEKADGSNNPAVRVFWSVPNWGGIMGGISVTEDEKIITQEKYDKWQDDIDRQQALRDAELAQMTQIWKDCADGPITLGE